jgi:DNA-binding MarR family transcriptional regulator
MGDDEDYLRLDLQVCFPLYAASNLLGRLYRPVLAPLGLTYPQYLVMLVLWQEAPQSVSALGDRLHLDSGTLTPLLKRMESAGLVTRTRDAADERRVLIGLTEQGVAQRQAARDVPSTLASGLSLSSQELADLRASVQHLVAVLAHPGTT